LGVVRVGYGVGRPLYDTRPFNHPPAPVATSLPVTLPLPLAGQCCQQLMLRPTASTVLPQKTVFCISAMQNVTKSSQKTCPLVVHSL